MTPHPRYQHTLEDLFLTVFVHIDDWLKPYQFVLPKQPAQKASYSELFTIAIVGEILAQPYESTWYWIVQQTFRSLFPDLPHYTRYHRILRNAEKLVAELALSVVPKDSTHHVIDSKPLPVAKGKRASWAKFPEAVKGHDLARWGWCSASNCTRSSHPQDCSLGLRAGEHFRCGGGP